MARAGQNSYHNRRIAFHNSFPTAISPAVCLAARISFSNPIRPQIVGAKIIAESISERLTEKLPCIMLLFTEHENPTTHRLEAASAMQETACSYK